MTESESEVDFSSGLKIPRFNGKQGEDYGLWRMRLRAACRVKGVWGIVESSSDSNSESTTTSSATTSVTSSVKREKASGIIISALGDAPLRVVIEAEDDPAKMIKLLDARYASNRTVSRIAIQTQLFRMSYNGQNMASYIDQYSSLFSQLERMGKDTAIPESHKGPMLLASINPDSALESTAAALRTKEVSELTWDYVATTLIDEYNARQSNGLSKSRRKKKMSRLFKSQPSRDVDTDGSDLESTVKAFAAALQSSKPPVLVCEFCQRKGHTVDRCFLNPDNPNHRLPPKMLEAITSKKTGALIVQKPDPPSHSTGSSSKSTKPKVEFTGSMLESTSVQPPSDSRTYADSGATVHCFNSLSLFVPG